jgi:hypothetical protein
MHLRVVSKDVNILGEGVRVHTSPLDATARFYEPMVYAIAYLNLIPPSLSLSAMLDAPGE